MEGAINVLKCQYLLTWRCKNKDLVTNSMPLLIFNFFLIIFLFLKHKFHIAFSLQRGNKLSGTVWKSIKTHNSQESGVPIMLRIMLRQYQMFNYSWPNYFNSFFKKKCFQSGYIRKKNLFNLLNIFLTKEKVIIKTLINPKIIKKKIK